MSVSPAFHSKPSTADRSADMHRDRKRVVSDRPRVVVADDHHAMLDTLVQMLSNEFEVVAAVSDGLSLSPRPPSSSRTSSHSTSQCLG